MSWARRLAAALLATAAACSSPAPRSDAAGGPGTDAPAFELRLASSQEREGWTEMPVRGGGSLLVAAQPLLTPAAVDNAARSARGDSLILNVRSSNRGVLQAATSDHMYKPVVFLMDGQAVYMAVLGMPLSRQVAIRIGPDGLTSDEADACIEAVRRAGR
ncbi:MAG: hypothetical protein ACO32J_07990 [Phycisphaerales bacterium]